MKKIIFSLLFGAVSFAALSQVTLTADAKATKAFDEIKKELISSLKLSADAADRIIVIEDEFYKTMELIKADGNIKSNKKNIAHHTRRTKLMGIPLTGRQMEDVITLVEDVRRKHKL